MQFEFRQAAPRRQSAHCAKAYAAKSRYQKKLLGNKRLPMETRVAFFRALVLPTLLYGLETLQMTVTDTLRLESVQMGLLRAVTHAWRHKGGATNEALRSLHAIPTIESALRLRRLQWWRRVLTQEGPAAVIVAVKGTVRVGDHSTTAARGFLQTLLEADIRALACARGREGSAMDACALDAYLRLAPRPALGLVREHHTPERPKQNHEGLPEKKCPDCSKCFHTHSQLAVHRRCSHGLVTERSLVTSTECPACHKNFASRDGARSHFQKRLCPESRNPDTMEPILNPPTVTPAPSPAPVHAPGSAQAMWGLTALLLTQSSTACAATFSNLCKELSVFPVEIGSIISSRGSTREQKPPEPRVSVTGPRDVERAVPGQRGRKTMPWKVPTAVPGLSLLPPPRGILPHSLPPLVRALGRVPLVHSPRPLLLFLLLPLHLLLPHRSLGPPLLGLGPRERVRGKELPWEATNGPPLLRIPSLPSEWCQQVPLPPNTWPPGDTLATTLQPGAILDLDWPPFVNNDSMRGWQPQRRGRPTAEWEYSQAYPDETSEGILLPGHIHHLRVLRHALNGSCRWISPSHLASWWNLPIKAWRPHYPCQGAQCGTGHYGDNCSLVLHWLLAAPKLELPARALVSAVSLHAGRLQPTPEEVSPGPSSHSSAVEGDRGPGQGLPPAGGTLYV